MGNLFNWNIGGEPYHTPGADIYTKYGSVNSRQRRKVQRILRLLRIKIAYRVIGRANRALIWRKAMTIAFFASYFEFKGIRDLTSKLRIKRSDWKRSRANQFRKLFVHFITHTGVLENVLISSLYKQAHGYMQVMQLLNHLRNQMRLMRSYFGPEIFTVSEDELTKDWLIKHASDRFIRMFLLNTTKGSNKTLIYILDIEGRLANRMRFVEMLQHNHPVMDVLLAKLRLARHFLNRIKDMATYRELIDLLGSTEFRAMDLSLTRKRLSKSVAANLMFNIIYKTIFLLGLQVIDAAPIKHKVWLGPSLAIEGCLDYEHGCYFNMTKVLNPRDNISYVTLPLIEYQPSKV